MTFTIAGVRPEKHAAAPALSFRLRIEDAAPVHAAMLRCQVQVEPRRRGYSPAEQDRLLELFGAPARWRDTLRPLVWTHAALAVPAFEQSVEVDLPVPCTYDFEVASTKYLHAIEDGEIPLLFLFSGTVFAKTENGYSVRQVPWDREAAFRLPAGVWRELMDAYYPGCGWIRLRRESLDALQRFKAERALTSWEDAIEALLDGVREPAS